MAICRYCEKEIGPQEADVTYPYWNFGHKPPSYPCHKACKVAGQREEAYQCQCIDADCNDCIDFIRDADKTARVVFKGTCRRYGKPTVGTPNHCSNMPCFRHRRDPNPDMRPSVGEMPVPAFTLFSPVDPTSTVEAMRRLEEIDAEKYPRI